MADISQEDAKDAAKCSAMHSTFPSPSAKAKASLLLRPRNRILGDFTLQAPVSQVRRLRHG